MKNLTPTMNKQLEEEAYRLCQSHCLVDKYGKAESDAMDALLEFVKSDVVKSFHTKEAMELIEELKESLKIFGFFFEHNENELISKAETFLNK